MDLSIQEEMPSGPEEVLGGRFEMREIMSLSVHRSGLGLGMGSESGGMGERGGAEELKHDEKKELRHCALSEFDSTGESLERRVGMEEDDFRRDLTNDQNLEGE